MHHYMHCPWSLNSGTLAWGWLSCPPLRGTRNVVLFAPGFPDASASIIARRALAVCCVYSAANAARHGTTAVALEALWQYAMEACAVHPGLAAIVAAVSHR